MQITEKEASVCSCIVENWYSCWRHISGFTGGMPVWRHLGVRRGESCSTDSIPHPLLLLTWPCWGVLVPLISEVLLWSHHSSVLLSISSLLHPHCWLLPLTPPPPPSLRGTFTPFCLHPHQLPSNPSLCVSTLSFDRLKCCELRKWFRMTRLSPGGLCPLCLCRGLLGEDMQGCFSLSLITKSLHN